MKPDRSGGFDRLRSIISSPEGPELPEENDEYLPEEREDRMAE